MKKYIKVIVPMCIGTLSTLIAIESSFDFIGIIKGLSVIGAYIAGILMALTKNLG